MNATQTQTQVPSYLQNEKSNNTCLMCLIQNEQILSPRLSNGMKAAATLNFRSFCTLGDLAECCIISPDGQPYGNSPVCLEGVCSHKMPEFQSNNLRK